MIYSFNEIDAMAKWAARGAGLPWGLAEEAGKAVRWICAKGLPGADALAHVLELNRGRSYEQLAPLSTDGVWEARSGSLCPLIAGAALSDLADDIAKGREIVLGRAAKPILLSGYLAPMARRYGGSVTLRWKEGTIRVSRQGVGLGGSAVHADYAQNIRCFASSSDTLLFKSERPGNDIAPATWEKLTGFMTLYLAPNTEASRMAGAGAGDSDND